MPGEERETDNTASSLAMPREEERRGSQNKGRKKKRDKRRC